MHRAVEHDREAAQETGLAQGPPKPKPSLPPRLPPRSNSSNLASALASSSPPPTYESVVDESKPAGNTYIDQQAADRLSKAGISVPGLGIGQSDKTNSTERSQSESSPTCHLNELQSRFSRMNKTSTLPQPSSSPVSTQGTTLAQKQAAVKTAQSFHKDPSSVSLTDARSAASTANSFRERHQEQISAGAQKANSWNKKLNITGRVNSFLEQQASPAQSPQGQQPSPPVAPNPSPSPTQPAATTPDLSNRRPPPPPPPKKPSGLHGQATGGGQAPPPVPLGTKPSFG